MTSRRRPTPSPFLALGLATAVAVGAAHGQDVSIGSAVTDTTDLVLPGVTVEVRDAARGGATFADGTASTPSAGSHRKSTRSPSRRPGFNARAQVVEVGAGGIADLMSV